MPGGTVLRHAVPRREVPRREVAAREVPLPTRADRRQAQAAISYYLREPLRETRRILRLQRRRLRELHCLRELPQPAARLRACADRFDCPALPALRERLRVDRRSRIIATYHLGNYLYGLNYLSQQLGDLRRVSCLILERLSATCYRNLALAFGEGAATPGQMLIVGESSAVALSKLLRAPDRVLFIFVDLPPGFGRRASVRLLGREGGFGSGAATLAVLNRVPVLPLLLEARGAAARLRLGPEMEPRLPGEETRQDSMARINQTFATALSTQLRRDPANWRYLGLLPDYYRKTGAAASPPGGSQGSHHP